jgi:curved DNA-binding protein CbpA
VAQRRWAASGSHGHREITAAAKVLNVSGSSVYGKDLKKAYLAQVREHHPDGGGSEAKMKEITTSYELLKSLSDAERRSFAALSRRADDPLNGARPRNAARDDPSSPDYVRKENRHEDGYKEWYDYESETPYFRPRAAAAPHVDTKPYFDTRAKRASRAKRNGRGKAEAGAKKGRRFPWSDAVDIEFGGTVAGKRFTRSVMLCVTACVAVLFVWVEMLEDPGAADAEEHW